MINNQKILNKHFLLELRAKIEYFLFKLYNLIYFYSHTTTLIWFSFSLPNPNICYPKCFNLSYYCHLIYSSLFGIYPSNAFIHVDCLFSSNPNQQYETVCFDVEHSWWNIHVFVVLAFMLDLYIAIKIWYEQQVHVTVW